MKGKIFLAIVVLMLTACTGRYAGFQNTMYACGYPNAAVSKLYSCMSTKVTASKRVGENDFYNKSGRDILSKIGDGTYDARVRTYSGTYTVSVEVENGKVKRAKVQLFPPPIRYEPSDRFTKPVS